jgi:hypothetical protein
MVLDQTRVCGSSNSPVSRMPRGASCAATHARASTTNALLVHSVKKSWATRSWAAGSVGTTQLSRSCLSVARSLWIARASASWSSCDRPGWLRSVNTTSQPVSCAITRIGLLNVVPSDNVTS